MKSERDLAIVDNILSVVLPLYNDNGTNSFVVDGYTVAKQQSKEVLIRFNPETHVVVTKDQLDITQQIQALSGVASKVNRIEAVQNDDSKRVKEVHARMTNDLTIKKEKPLTKKQREKAELEAMLAEAHNRVRANGYTIK